MDHEPRPPPAPRSTRSALVPHTWDFPATLFWKLEPKAQSSLNTPPQNSVFSPVTRRLLRGQAPCSGWQSPALSTHGGPRPFQAPGAQLMIKLRCWVVVLPGSSEGEEMQYRPPRSTLGPNLEWCPCLLVPSFPRENSGNHST